MKAYVLIKVQIGEIPDVVHSLRSKKNVLSADMTFGPYDAVALVEGSDLDDLGNVIAFSVQCTPGVLETLTCLTVNI